MMNDKCGLEEEELLCYGREQRRDNMAPLFSLDMVEKFGSGLNQAEGVVIDKDNNVYGGGRDSVLRRVSPDGTVTEIARIEGSIPNGITLDRQGNLVFCDLGKKAMMSCSLDGKVSLLADHAGDLRLNTPNFASYDAAGNLYVSNSSSKYDYPHLDPEFQTPAPNGQLVCIRPNGRGEVVAAEIYLANGTAIAPDESAVYVLESTRFDCLRIAIKKDGTFGKPEIYAQNFPGVPDGMAFDVQGNLYVTIPARIENGRFRPANMILKIDPTGFVSTLLDDPKGQTMRSPTNCAFGGPGLQDLYIANLGGDFFSRVHTPFRGHPLYHQR
jgi:gluconolactonase